MAGRHRQDRPRGGRHRRPPARPRWVAPAVTVAAVVAAGVGGTAAALSVGSSAPAHVPLPRVALPAFVGDASPSAAAPVPAAPTPAPSQVLAATLHRLPDFAVTTVGRVAWVQVTGPSGKALYVGMLRHGHTVTFRARPLRVTVGDAGAVRIVLHHHRQPRGKPGAVRRFVVR